MNFPTYIRDVDISILLEVPDQYLKNVNQLSKYARELVTSDDFLFRRYQKYLNVKFYQEKPDWISAIEWYLFWREHKTDKISIQLKLTLEQAYIRIKTAQGNVLPGSEAFQSVLLLLYKAIRNDDREMIEYMFNLFSRIYGRVIQDSYITREQLLKMLELAVSKGNLEIVQKILSVIGMSIFTAGDIENLKLLASLKSKAFFNDFINLIKSNPQVIINENSIYHLSDITLGQIIEQQRYDLLDRIIRYSDDYNFIINRIIKLGYKLEDIPMEYKQHVPITQQFLYLIKYSNDYEYIMKFYKLHAAEIDELLNANQSFEMVSAKLIRFFLAKFPMLHFRLTRNFAVPAEQFRELILVVSEFHPAERALLMLARYMSNLPIFFAEYYDYLEILEEMFNLDYGLLSQFIQNRDLYDLMTYMFLKMTPKQQDDVAGLNYDFPDYFQKILERYHDGKDVDYYNEMLDGLEGE